jgi:predicted Zn-dependent protease
MLRTIITVLLFALVVGYFAALNTATVRFYWGPDKFKEMPLMFLIYISFGIGMLIALLSLLARDTIKAYKNYKQKKLEETKRFAEELYNQGVDEILKGNMGEAEKKLQEALQKNPDNMKVYLRLAEIREKQNKLREALDILLKAKERWQDNIDISFRLAHYYEKLQEFNSAVDILKKLIEQDSENIEALRMLRDIYARNDFLESAYRTQKEIMKISKKTPSYFVERKLLGQFKFGYVREILKEEDYDKAIKKSWDVIKLDPEFVPAYVTLGEIYLKHKGSIEKASEIWENGYNEIKHPVFLIKLEEMYLDNDKPSEALEAFKRLLLKNPDDAVLTLFYAKLCLRLEMLDDAIEQLNSLDGKGISSTYLHLLMAEAHARKGNYYHSVNEFRKATEIAHKIIIPFTCSSCGNEFREWTAICKNCGKVNTLKIEIGFETQRKVQELKAL